MHTKTQTMLELLNACDGRKLNRVDHAGAIYARRAGFAAVHQDDLGEKWINLTTKGAAKRDALAAAK